jgi:ribulose-phosphate 3-epimerase
MEHLVCPSFLSANLGNIEGEVKMINHSKADWIHLDIMDGLFVPNISFGFPIIEVVKKVAVLPLDVHLMIVEPSRYISSFRNAGADRLTVQYEACTHLNRVVTEIRDLGMKAGVAVNPHTPVSLLKNILPYIDMVLIMTVNPGFGGQSFITESYNKIAELRKMIDDGGYNVLIEVDGGVDIGNAGKLIESGVDVLVAGSSIFNSENPVETIRMMKQLSFV